MHRPSTLVALASLSGALLLTACNNDPEEAAQTAGEDMEAIALDDLPPVESVEASDGSIEPQPGTSAATDGADRADTDRADAAAPSSGTQAPAGTDAMMSGSNEAGARAPDPKRSKLIKADPAS